MEWISVRDRFPGQVGFEFKEEMQEQLGRTVPEVIQAEYGTVGNIAFAECKMCDADGEEVVCKCGKHAGTALIGKESYVARCNDCMGYN